MYDTQRESLDSQGKFVANVLHLCKSQSCQQATDFLADCSKKVDFYSKASTLLQCKEVKQTWRTLKRVYSDSIVVGQNLDAIMQVLFG